MPTPPVARSANLFADMFRVDISNADVVFVNNVAFDESLNAQLLRKIHFNTRPGEHHETVSFVVVRARVK